MFTILVGLLFYESNYFEFRGLIPGRQKFPVCPVTEHERVKPLCSACQAVPWYTLEAQHHVEPEKQQRVRHGAVNVQHKRCIFSGLCLKVPYNVTF